MIADDPQQNTVWRGKAWRWALVALGILAGQFVLYGPALIGGKLLLPLGCLAEGRNYLPRIPGTPAIASPQPVLLDFTFLIEPDRLFAARELAAGRFPEWVPNRFGGAPFLWLKYSPFYLLTALSESPDLLGVAQLLLALVAGFGAFAFGRRVLGLGYWPSAIAAWCYPIMGWFVLFQGMGPAPPIALLPWLLCAIDGAVRARPLAGVAVALVTALVVLSGQLDIAAQALLVSVLFGLWRLWDVHRGALSRHLKSRAALLLPAGAILGVLMAAPQILPMREYAREGNRFALRQEGQMARAPLGLIALPQIVLPDMYGTFGEQGASPLLEPAEQNQLESPAECYAGLLATLLLAPWAFLDRQRRSTTLFLLGLGFFGMAFVLNVPGFVQLHKLPGLRLLSANRLAFATGFSLLMLAAVGLEGLQGGALARRPRLGVQLAILAGLLGWCVYRSAVLPEPLATEYEGGIRLGHSVDSLRSIEELHAAQDWFTHRYQKAAVFCLLGIEIWLVLRFRPQANRRVFPLVGALLVADLLLFGYGKRIPQPRSLYYPEVPALKQLAAAPPGRVLGVDCFPANLAQAVGLSDVRGYDAVDPYRWIRLLWVGARLKSPVYEYAAVQYLDAYYRFVPPNTIRFPPVLDMVALRYAIFRGHPPAGLSPRFQSPDYWIMENPAALPRVFVPNRVEVVPDGEAILGKLSLPSFDARRVAYVENAVDLPGAVRGEAEIRAESPARVVVNARMTTAGLVVLADNWDAGWRVYVNGKRAPLLRTNYALRGVILPAGEAEVEFRYQPASVRWGRAIALSCLLVVAAFAGLCGWRRRRPSPKTAAATS
jgi:hypothetical protein